MLGLKYFCICYLKLYCLLRLLNVVLFWLLGCSVVVIVYACVLISLLFLYCLLL